jgi:hypothetical protein
MREALPPLSDALIVWYLIKLRSNFTLPFTNVLLKLLITIRDTKLFVVHSVRFGHLTSFSASDRMNDEHTMRF